MKRTILTAVIMMTFALSASAQRPGHGDGNWKERMMSEKIAFLTIELDLTAEEAQAFWPVYNESGKAQDEARKYCFNAMKALNEALDSDKSDAEIEKLLEDYLTAKKALKSFNLGSYDKFKEVLSTKKLAKLYLSEEKFRKHHIRKLNDKPSPKKR